MMGSGRGMGRSVQFCNRSSVILQNALDFENVGHGVSLSDYGVSLSDYGVSLSNCGVSLSLRGC